MEKGTETEGREKCRDRPSVRDRRASMDGQTDRERETKCERQKGLDEQTANERFFFFFGGGCRERPSVKDRRAWMDRQKSKRGTEKQTKCERQKGLDGWTDRDGKRNGETDGIGWTDTEREINPPPLHTSPPGCGTQGAACASDGRESQHHTPRVLCIRASIVRATFLRTHYTLRGSTDGYSLFIPLSA